MCIIYAISSFQMKKEEETFSFSEQETLGFYRFIHPTEQRCIDF